MEGFDRPVAAVAMANLEQKLLGASTLSISRSMIGKMPVLSAPAGLCPLRFIA